MNYDKLRKEWLKEEEYSFKGWDFSHLNNRISEEPLPWCYKDIIAGFLKSEDKLLDMGTGGGEFLLTLNHPFQKTFVTESYLPNLELCKEKLGEFGISVNYVEDDARLPFESATFDVVINRHESYNLSEVSRILKPNGVFITQQVGSFNNLDLAKFILQAPDRKTDFDNQLSKELEKAIDHNLKHLYSDEYFPYLRFFDVGALVYFAKIIEWEFPDFSVNKCFDQLVDLHNEITDKGYIESKEHRFLLVFRKESY